MRPAPAGRRIVFGVFGAPEALLAGVRAVREAGWEIEDVHTPFPVHGLPEAMGLRPSRLPVVCFLFGLGGVSLSLWFQYWTTAIDWPVNVGGKPWNSLPAFIPVTFETMVLLAGVGVFLSFLAVSGLRPGRRPRALPPGATDDRFVMCLSVTDSAHDAEAARALLGPLGGETIEVVER